MLVPICNVERYLCECLDSAVAQTLKDIEIICINDGSTDTAGYHPRVRRRDPV
ncbi:MAG: glycosyltransferase family A protein [Collinsella sp.]